MVIVPLLVGTGTRLKALEAMAAARPLVGTTVGLEGIGVHDGIHARVADEPGSFARAVIELLGGETLARGLAEAGRAHVEQRFAWEQIGKQLVETVSGLLVTEAPAAPRETFGPASRQ